MKPRKVLNISIQKIRNTQSLIGKSAHTLKEVSKGENATSLALFRHPFYLSH
jgi:hypothetical protein